MCPVTLLANWAAEVRKLLPAATKVLFLDSGNKRRVDTAALAEFDLVITAYTLLVQSPVLECDWHRLVLDESQNVKHHNSQQSRLVAKIRAARRWAMSGTPCTTSIDDLAGHFAALHVPPFDSPQIFQMVVAKPAAEVGDKQNLQPLLKLLSTCMLRHTKGSEGVQCEVPPISIDNCFLTPSDSEQASYAAVHDKVLEKVAQLERANTFSRFIGRVNALLLRLRMASDHASLAEQAMARLHEGGAHPRAPPPLPPS